LANGSLDPFGGVAMTSSKAGALDPALTEFIAAAVPSVWALELLLLLKRDQGRTWQAAALVAELRASAPLVDQCLDALQRGGVVVADNDGARYAPAGASLEDLCDRLEAAYAERSVAVVNAIVSARRDPLVSFAESFRVRGWKK
jgi:hypothetical protein